MRLSKAQIRETSDAHQEEVEVPEWGGTVVIRSLTAKERDEFDARLINKDGKGIGKLEGLRALIVARCAMQEDGGRMFDDADVDWLETKNGRAIDRLATVAMRLSGFNDGVALEAATGN